MDIHTSIRTACGGGGASFSAVVVGEAGGPNWFTSFLEEGSGRLSAQRAEANYTCVCVYTYIYIYII